MNRRYLRAFAVPRLLLIAAVIGGFVFTGFSPAHAASITVTGNGDTIAVDGICTLREAITSANTDIAPNADCVAGSGADTITFSGNFTITLTSNLPTITTALTINGLGAANTQIVGGADIRGLTVGIGGNLTLDGVTIKGGQCIAICPITGPGGGGIDNL